MTKQIETMKHMYALQQQLTEITHSTSRLDKGDEPRS